MNELKRILITARIDSERAINISSKIYEMLSLMDFETLLERELAWKLNLKGGVSIRDVDVDAVIVVGGDGTILKVANEVKERGIPILSVNAGTVGFLSELDPEEIYKIPEVLSGKYTIKECTRVKATIKSFFTKNQVIKNAEEIYPVKDALNEITVITSIPSKVINLEVRVEDEELFSGRGDGIIISTTTGATAYSLSAGGPIVDPALDVFIITMLSPLSLINRSIIVPVNSKIEVRVCDDGVDAYMSTDGRDHIFIPAGTNILFEKSEFKTKIICTKEKDFYKKLKRRLKREL
ncbi:MAG: NAD(+)/NADH kinase [Candidatus Methanomethylicia archaeon]